MTREAILAALFDERRRQEELHPGQTCANPELSLYTKLAVLTEEVGEVARSILDCEGRDRQRAELVQVAAVAFAWLESL